MEIPKIDHAARAHLEKLGENPNQLVRETELHTIKEKQQRTPLEKKKGQIVSSIRRALIDKTASDELARRMLVAHQRRELSTNTQNTQSIVFVHGFYGTGLVPVAKGSSAGDDLSTYWGPAKQVISDQGWQGDFRIIKYYSGDINHSNGASSYSADLHDPMYANNCTNFSAGHEGTNDESIDHLSCLFAQYLYQNFGQTDSRVALIGHSMGGIIIRNTLYMMQEYAGQDPFPPSVGEVTDAITLNTPHTGIVSEASLYCGGCQQLKDLDVTSPIMSTLSQYGRNPQASTIPTDWTVVGSESDILINNAASTGAANAIDMNARHAIIYSSPPGYDHLGALNDIDITNQDAHQYYCDTPDPNNNPCGTAYQGGNWIYRENAPHSLLEVYTELTSDAS